MKKLFTFFAVAAMAFAVQAGEWTFADGTDTNQYIPFRASYLNWPPYYGQVIYPAGQLTELAGKDITALTFYIANENGNVMNGGELSFYLGEVQVSEFSTISPFRIPLDSLTLVGAMPMTPGESQIVVNFTTPYSYQGRNLALMVSVTQAGTFSGNGFFYGKNVDVPCAIYGGQTIFTETFYPKTTFTYEEGSAQTAVNLIAQANALEEDKAFTFNGDAVVTLQHDDFLFVRDNSGFGQIRGAVDGELENGQVLNQGWSATKTGTDGWAWYIDPAGISASGETNAELAAPIVLTGAVDESMLNAYVVIENQPKSFFPARSYTLPDGTTIAKTDVLWPMNENAGTTKYNVYGIICKAGGEMKINPVKFEEYVEPTFLRGDLNKDTKVNISDVTALINYLLSHDASTIDVLAADCNQNGDVTISDVTALINYLMSNTWD